MKLIYKNIRGETLDLLNNENHFAIIGADNLHGVDLEWAENESPYADGTDVDESSVRALPRGIILTFQLVGDVQESKDLFTSIIKSKQIGYLIETDENGRETEIKGIAKVPPYTRLSAACQIQLELYCGFPYWQDIARIVTEINDVIDLLYLPEIGRGFPASGVPFGYINLKREQTIKNDGDTAVGMIIHIIAEGAVSNPRISCSTGRQNGWYMELDVDMAQNDEIIINTTKRQKDITYNGARQIGGDPIMNLLTIVGDDWLQLEQGDNTFNITASDDTLVYFTIEYKRCFE